MVSVPQVSSRCLSPGYMLFLLNIECCSEVVLRIESFVNKPMLSQQKSFEKTVSYAGNPGCSAADSAWGTRAIRMPQF